MGRFSFSCSPLIGRRRPGWAYLAVWLAIASLAFGVWLAPGWGGEAIGRAASGGRVYDPAAPKIYYVDADSTASLPTGLSWNEAFRELQDALALAAYGDQIWVAEGVYVPTQRSQPEDARSATFKLAPGVRMYGGFDPDNGVDEFDERDWQVYASVLSGDLDGDDGASNGPQDGASVWTPASVDEIVGANAYHVVSGENLSETARLDGFVICGGQATGAATPQTQGGGMFNQSSQARLSNLVFKANSAASGGGMYNEASAPRLSNVRFEANQANSGGGMYNSSSRPQLVNVTMNGNQAANGGGMLNVSSIPGLVNTTLVGNLADYGGAIFNCSSGPRLVNSDLISNQASHSGGGVFSMYYSSSQVINSILWNNAAAISGDQFSDDGSSMTVFSYSLWEGMGGELDADPVFVRNPDPGDGHWDTLADNDYGDLRLDDASPAIDAGDNSQVPSDLLDLDGDGDLDERLPLDLGMAARFVDHLRPDSGLSDPPHYPYVIDIGAYETRRPAEWLLYWHNFEGPVSTEWGCTTIQEDITPSGRGFLGQFGNQRACLSFSGQSPHQGVRLSFDLYVIRSWNGNVHSAGVNAMPSLGLEEIDPRAAQMIVGPDRWSVEVDGAPLLFTTFANVLEFKQAYPGWYPGSEYPRYSGAAEKNSLGYVWGIQPMDAVYHLSFIFAHTTADLELDFYAEGLQPITNESWGLDNMQVSLLSELSQVYLPLVTR